MQHQILACDAKKHKLSILRVRDTKFMADGRLQVLPSILQQCGLPQWWSGSLDEPHSAGGPSGND